MDALTNFEMAGGRGYFRPSGAVTLDQVVDMIDAALAFARAQGLHEVVVNVTALTGFAAPTVLERYRFSSRWASTVGGRVRVALVACPELIDPQRFGVTVAANRGMAGNVFVSEADAVAWLDHKPNGFE